jgi:nuclear pore complex protein Nup155
LIIFECANHRNEADINSTWQYYLDYTHSKVADDPANTTQQPYEAVINMLREMSQRLKNSEATFSPLTLIPMIENYALEQQFGVGPPTWVPDLFIQVGFPFETILSTLQTMYMGDIAPFTGRYKHVLADHMVYVCEMWYKDCMRANSRLFGSEENAAGIVEVLEMLQGNAPNQQDAGRIENLTNKIIRTYQ